MSKKQLKAIMALHGGIDSLLIEGYLSNLGYEVETAKNFSELSKQALDENGVPLFDLYVVEANLDNPSTGNVDHVVGLYKEIYKTEKPVRFISLTATIGAYGKMHDSGINCLLRPYFTSDITRILQNSEKSKNKREHLI